MLIYQTLTKIFALSDFETAAEHVSYFFIGKGETWHCKKQAKNLYVSTSHYSKS